MIILIINRKNSTNLNKNVNLHISKRFFPRGTLILHPNIMLNKKKIMLPNALLGSFTPRTTTHLFVSPKNNINFQKVHYKHPFNENNFNQNISLSEKIHLLALKDPNEKFTSGLMSLSPQEYMYLNITNQSIEAIPYKTTIKTQLAKSLYILFGTDQNIPLKIKFEWIFDVVGVPVTNMPHLLHNKKFITLYQHLLTFICYDKVISYKTLKDFALESTEIAENPFQIVLNNILEKLEQQFPNDKLEIMFPSTTCIDNERRLEFLEDFVQNHFQDDTELLERILSNMKLPLYLNAN